MTIEEVAHYLNVKPSKVRSMVFRKELPFLKIGRLVRFSRNEIDQWLGGLARQPVLKEGGHLIFDSSILNGGSLQRRSL